MEEVDTKREYLSKQNKNKEVEDEITLINSGNNVLLQMNIKQFEEWLFSDIENEEEEIFENFNEIQQLNQKIIQLIEQYFEIENLCCHLFELKERVEQVIENFQLKFPEIQQKFLIYNEEKRKKQLEKLLSQNQTWKFNNKNLKKRTDIQNSFLSTSFKNKSCDIHANNFDQHIDSSISLIAIKENNNIVNNNQNNDNDNDNENKRRNTVTDIDSFLRTSNERDKEKIAIENEYQSQLLIDQLHKINTENNINNINNNNNINIINKNILINNVKEENHFFISPEMRRNKNIHEKIIIGVGNQLAPPSPSFLQQRRTTISSPHDNFNLNNNLNNLNNSLENGKSFFRKRTEEEISLFKGNKFLVENQRSPLFYNNNNNNINFECTICLEEKEENPYTFTCGHSFCKECVLSGLHTRILNGEVLNIKCFDRKCGSLINDQEIGSIVNENDYNKYQQFLFIANLRENNEVKYCPINSCSQINVITKNDRIYNKTPNKVKCSKCGHKFCCNCGKEYHPKITCEEWKNRLISLKKINNEEEINFQAINKLKGKNCPRCKFYILKDGGCNHVLFFLFFSLNFYFYYNFYSSYCD